MSALQAQTKRLNEERHLKCHGIAKVTIDALVFGPDDESRDVNVDLKKVGRLKRIFKLEGCDRLNRNHYIPGEISHDVLREAMERSNLNTEDLHSACEPRMLHLPPSAIIRCAYGKSRIKALEEFSHFDRWWTIELYIDISPEGFSIISEEFENEGSYSDGHVLTMICLKRLQDPVAEKRWWARLTKSKADILKRLLKHDLLAPIITRILLEIPGTRAGFEIGTWHKIIGAKCPEEVVHYLELVYQTWLYIMGSKAALRLVDTSDVQCLELRAPAVSRSDDQHISIAISSGEAFKSVTDGLEREHMVARIRRIQHLIPTIRTLQKDFKYLRLCTDTLKQLILGSTRLPCTAQTIAFDALQSRNGSVTLESFSRSQMKLLYLRIMQSLVELTRENPLLDDNTDALEPRRYDQRAWNDLAIQAKNLGFHSEEISRLIKIDPDREAAHKVLLDARPPSDYEYNAVELESLVESISQAFKGVHQRRPGTSAPPLTTSGTGEPISRRCGRQYSSAYARDRHFLTPAIFACSVPKLRDITSLFVRKSVFCAFWGLIDDTFSSDTSSSYSPRPVSDDEMPDWRLDIISRERSPLIDGEEMQGLQHNEPQNQELTRLEEETLDLANQRSLQSSTVFNNHTPLGNHHAIVNITNQMDTDEPLMGIFVLGSSGWHMIKQCRRASIIEGINDIWQTDGRQGLKLSNSEGRGIALDDCPTLGESYVYLSVDGAAEAGFPAGEPEEEL